MFKFSEIHAASVSHCIKISSNTNLLDEDKYSLEKFSKSDPLSKVTKYTVQTIEELRASIFAVQRTLENGNGDVS